MATKKSDRIIEPTKYLLANDRPTEAPAADPAPEQASEAESGGTGAPKAAKGPSRRISFWLDEQDYLEFKIYLLKHGLTASKYMTDLFRQIKASGGFRD